MTTMRRDGGGTPFGDWLRAHPELDARSNDLSATDCDMWLHKYRLRDEPGTSQAIDHLMLVEVKCHSANVPYAQADTLSVIDLLLRKASSYKGGNRDLIEIPDRRTGRPGAMRKVRWLGAHVLQLSDTRPDNSDLIVWNGIHDLSEDGLVELLKFARDPDHPSRPLNTRRHHLRPARERHPELAIIVGGAE